MVNPVCGRPSRIDQFSGGKTVLTAGVDQRVNGGEQIHVRVQQKDKFGIGRRDALIYGGGESSIFAVRDSLRVP